MIILGLLVNCWGRLSEKKNLIWVILICISCLREKITKDQKSFSYLSIYITYTLIPILGFGAGGGEHCLL